MDNKKTKMKIKWKYPEYNVEDLKVIIRFVYVTLVSDTQSEHSTKSPNITAGYRAITLQENYLKKLTRQNKRIPNLGLSQQIDK